MSRRKRPGWFETWCPGLALEADIKPRLAVSLPPPQMTQFGYLSIHRYFPPAVQRSICQEVLGKSSVSPADILEAFVRLSLTHKRPTE